MACTACSTNPYSPMMAPGYSPMMAPGFNPVASPTQGLDASMVGAGNMMLMAMTELLMMLMSMMSSSAASPMADALAPAADSPEGPSGAASPSHSRAPRAHRPHHSAPAAHAPESTGPVSGSAAGKKLAQAAENTANNMHSTGWCYRGVSQSLRSIGVTATGASAYMAADQLAKNPKMREIQVAAKDLPKLPAGAVVVWNRSSAHPHGHISVALGNGKEASDHIQNQMTNYGTSHRVFIPV